jgi:NitT/TauT family transport system ATP-binding protein
MGLSTMHMAAGDPARPPLIRMLGVAKAYRSAEGEVESLKPLAFDIHEGEFLSIVGPSGCGKSTLLKLVGGLLPATRGSIEIAGQRVEGPAGSVGIVFQNHVLLAWRTVLENIMLQIEVRKLPHERGLAHARELVEMVGLKGFENKYPWQLSGGMQQRASICRALVHDPAILLMDEPFGALDAMTREKMNLELQRIWSAAEKTVLLITHSIPESIFLSDRVLVMSERPGSIAAIYDVPLPRPRTLAMMGGTEFGALAQKIRAHFYAQGSLDA